jgi:hypothetical protein
LGKHSRNNHSAGVRRAGAVFNPDVEYVYSAFGNEYKSINVTLILKQTYNAEVAQQWVSQYPVGKQVNVFYNPETPQIAVLEKAFQLEACWF